MTLCKCPRQNVHERNSTMAALKCFDSRVLGAVGKDAIFLPAIIDQIMKMAAAEVDNKYVRLRGRPYIHICRSYVHTPRELDRNVSRKHHVTTRARWPMRLILGFWGAKFPKIGDSPFLAPMNRRAKFDAASFVVGGETRKRTNCTDKQTNEQTVNDISTPCLSAGVDEKQHNTVNLRYDTIRYDTVY